jgi:hypothetical protein
MSGKRPPETNGDFMNNEIFVAIKAEENPCHDPLRMHGSELIFLLGKRELPKYAANGWEIYRMTGLKKIESVDICVKEEA